MWTLGICFHIQICSKIRRKKCNLIKGFLFGNCHLIQRDQNRAISLQQTYKNVRTVTEFMNCKNTKIRYICFLWILTKLWSWITFHKNHHVEFFIILALIMSIALVMSMVWLLPERFPLSENISFGRFSYHCQKYNPHSHARRKEREKPNTPNTIIFSICAKKLYSIILIRGRKLYIWRARIKLYSHAIAQEGLLSLQKIFNHDTYFEMYTL